MNKIDELFELKSKITEVNSLLINKLDDLSASTEKYIFSIGVEKGFVFNIRNKRQDITLSLDKDEMKVLYDFLQNLLEEPKSNKDFILNDVKKDLKTK